MALSFFMALSKDFEKTSNDATAWAIVIAGLF